jgi:hypothetical protein
MTKVTGTAKGLMAVAAASPAPSRPIPSWFPPGPIAGPYLWQSLPGR